YCRLGLRLGRRRLNSAWRIVLELELRQQPVLSPGDLHTSGLIGHLQLGLLEHLLGTQSGRGERAREGGGLDFVVLGSLARSRRKSNDHAANLAFRDEALRGILQTPAEADVAACIDYNERGLRWDRFQGFDDLGQADTKDGQLPR